MTYAYDFTGTVLVLRLNRLSHIPPAKQGSEILSEKGVPVVVFEFGAEYESANIMQGAIPTVRLGFRWVNRFPQKMRALIGLLLCLAYLFQRIRRERPRFILTHGLQEQAAAYLLHRVFGIPYGCHVHEIFNVQDVSPLNRLLLFIEGPTLRAARFTVFSSEERAGIYRRRYDLRSKSFTAFNTPRFRKPVRSPGFYETQGIARDKKILLYVGGIAPLNISRDLVEALSFLPEEFVIVLAGWGDASYILGLKERASQLGLSSRVKFVGSVANKWDWIDNADAGLCIYNGTDLRSKYNAGPSNKLFEFISAGRPVIVNQADDFIRIVKENELGINVDPNNPREMARAIESMIYDPLKLKRIEQRANALHLSQFNYENQFQTVANQIQQQVDLEDLPKAA